MKGGGKEVCAGGEGAGEEDGEERVEEWWSG